MEVKKLISGVLLGTFLLTVIGCNAEPPKFGVVDVGKIVNSSQAGQKANAEIESLVKAKQAQLKEKEAALQKLERSLKEPGSKVKPEEMNKAMAEYQRLAATAEAEVKKKAQEFRMAMFEQIKKIIEAIGQEEKFLMIFTTDNVPYYQTTVDVTEKVIKKFDQPAEGK
jgi:outer membrane protein